MAEDTPRRYIDHHRAEILNAYARALEQSDNPLSRDRTALAQALANAGQILDDMGEALHGGELRLDRHHSRLAHEIGATRAETGVHPEQSLRAASAWFQAVVRTLEQHLPGDEEGRRVFALAVLSLEQSINARVREAATGYSSFLLNRVREAQQEERRRIARELHDRIGHWVSVTQRHLELFELYRDSEPVAALAKVQVAMQATLETMHNLRAVTSELHPPDPLNSLEKALLGYLESTSTEDAVVSAKVNGNEMWATPHVLDETFLILREAARNALGHGAPSIVLIRVDIAPHELRASVDDDGTGFDTTRRPVHGGGVGLRSMQERARAVGGSVAVNSSPGGGGTRVELLIPL
ncbi:sensor histidine kinase [Acrocarpospora catenulata]|uniref:sensor histidine kinase n=1 Tax=Acrocarpospora catenulata TaxID=2836182 RepID=UPI001BD95B56|nr:histidine kinase [Acrocarpospora catenulata]